MENILKILKRLSLPEDRRGAPGATAGGHSMRDGGDGELRDGQADLTNQTAGQQEHLRQTVSSGTSTVPAEDALASVSYLQPTTSTEIPWESINWDTTMKEELVRLYYESAKFETKMEKGYNLRTKFAAKYPNIKKVALRDLIAKVKDIRTNLHVTEERAMEIKQQVDLAWKDDGNEHQLEETESNGQAGAIDVLPQPIDDPTPPHPPEVDGLLQPEAEAEVQQPKKRRKWTYHMNRDVMRLYFLAEKCGQSVRREHHRLFLLKYPDLATKINEQNLADQKRSISVNRLLSAVEIAAIKMEVEQQLPIDELALEDVDNEDLIDAEGIGARDNEHHVPDPLEPHPDIHNDDVDREIPEKLQHLERRFGDALLEFRYVEPTLRHSLPKMNITNDLRALIAHLDSKVLPTYLNVAQTALEVQTLVYCAAVATVRTLGRKTRPSNAVFVPGRDRDPPWKIRLDMDVSKVRCKLGRLTQYKKGNRTRKLINHVTKIIQPRHIETLTAARLDEILDCQRQRLDVLTARLRRYKKSSARRQQNQNFQTDERRFYRELRERPNNQQGTEVPQLEDMTNYWSGVWGKMNRCNLDTAWFKLEEARASNSPDMQLTNITALDVSAVLKRASNWKAPGPDMVHNFWYKYLTSVHLALARCFQKIIEHPDLMPGFMLQGTTYMLPKKPDAQNPSDFRPIACLPTIYKCLTAIIADKVYSYCDENDILTEEQKGCCKNSRGCKDLVTIDAVAMTQARKHQRNLHMAYIDYKQAFPSVPHDYLLEVLKLYKICPRIIDFLSHAMRLWGTRIKYFDHGQPRITRSIRFTTGIFQGDSFSALWFCLALNPLSKTLNSMSHGFRIHDNEDGYQVTHLLYMDDLKLYASSAQKLQQVIDVTKQFSNDIHMEFGLDKCRIVHLIRGELGTAELENEFENDIEAMAAGESYKYLGILESKGIQHTIVKTSLTTAFTTRLRLIMKSFLNSANKIRAINTYAIPVLTYSFGLIKWSNTDLEKLNRIVRVEMTKHRMHHRNSAIERVVLPRHLGGRGVVDVKKLCESQVIQLRDYFNSKRNVALYSTICQADLDYTPLNLSSDGALNIRAETIEELEIQWRQKAIHGEHPKTLDQNEVDSEASNIWLRKGVLYPETEGFVIAIQDKVVSTRNYRKHVLHQDVVDRCRLCGDTNESIEHIIDGCRVMAQREYTHRHNDVAGIIHQQLALNLGLLKEWMPFYRYIPMPVLESEDYILYWDVTIQTDHYIRANRPDIVMREKTGGRVYIIDIACPLNRNLQSTYTTKIHKYSELRHEVKTIWRNVNHASIHPIVISATGNVHAKCTEHLEHLGVSGVLAAAQKAVLLNTCRIVRNFLDHQEVSD